MAAMAAAASRGISLRTDAWWPPGSDRRRPELAALIVAVLGLHAGVLSFFAPVDAPQAAAEPAPRRQPAAVRVGVAPAVVTPLRPDSATALAPVSLRANAVVAVAPAEPVRIASVAPTRAPQTAPALVPQEAPAAASPDAPAQGAAEPAAIAAASDLPLYPTLPPPAFAYAYDVQRGAERGSLTLRWSADGTRYEAWLGATLAGAPWLELRSSGGFDAAGLAPLRHTDRRRGRSLQAANFQRERGSISFSATQVERALAAGAQDRLSWMLQLAAIAAADPALAAPGGKIELAVVGVRGDADRWTFTHEGDETLALADGSSTPTVRLLRRPAFPYDTRAEVWLDPARHFLPVRVRLSNPPAGRDALQFDWRAAIAPP